MTRCPVCKGSEYEPILRFDDIYRGCVKAELLCCAGAVPEGAWCEWWCVVASVV